MLHPSAELSSRQRNIYWCDLNVIGTEVQVEARKAVIKQ